MPGPFTVFACWSQDSIRRIIYKFLNVCPFDYTVVAVSGKVQCSFKKRFNQTSGVTTVTSTHRPEVCAQSL